MINLSIESIKRLLYNKFDAVNSNSYNEYAGIFVVNCKRLVEYIETNTILKTLINKIEEEPVDFEAWDKFLIMGMGETDYLGLEKDIHICWKVLKRISELNLYTSKNNGIGDLIKFGSISRFSSSNNPSSGDNHLSVIVRRYIEPLTYYLAEKLNTELAVIYNIDRFTRRTREFDKELLSEMFNKNTQNGENNLDSFLRKYLFDQGIDTISTPKFYEGRTDILIESQMKSPDSVVIEIKLFKNEGNYKEDYLKSGFSSQLQPAVIHHGRNYGILFVFNLSDKYLEFITIDGGNPPKMIVGGRTFYIMHTDIYDKHKSSSVAKVETIKIDCRSWLT